MSKWWYTNLQLNLKNQSPYMKISLAFACLQITSNLNLGMHRNVFTYLKRSRISFFLTLFITTPNGLKTLVSES